MGTHVWENITLTLVVLPESRIGISPYKNHIFKYLLLKIDGYYKEKWFG